MQVGVKECVLLIDETDVDSHRVLGLLEDCHVMAIPKRKSTAFIILEFYTNAHLADFNVKNLQQDLANLLITSPLVHNYGIPCHC
jgi:hypothetical protein